jgi:hypothetical protein
MEVKLNFIRIRYLLTSLLSEGLSPDLHSLEQIQQIQRPTDVSDTGEDFFYKKSKNYSLEIV